jgi:hypothetical protein
LNVSELKIQKRFFFKVFNILFFFKDTNLYSFYIILFRRFRIYNFLIGKNFFFSEIFEVLWLVFFFKDTTLFVNWITWTLSSITYKKIKLFLHFLRNYLVNYFLPQVCNLVKIKGFLFDIRGKVGVTGDAKKRHVQIDWGQSSYTKKKLKFSLKQGIVKTQTGVMGVTVVITF